MSADYEINLGIYGERYIRQTIPAFAEPPGPGDYPKPDDWVYRLVVSRGFFDEPDLVGHTIERVRRDALETGLRAQREAGAAGPFKVTAFIVEVGAAEVYVEGDDDEE